MSVERLSVSLLAAVVAVAASGALAADAAGVSHPASRSAAGSPSVQEMIVGSNGAVLFGARTVSASATSVRVAGRSCSVAAGTPLAALAALRRAGAPGFALRDYGRCGASTRDSAELFVYSIGGQRNSGQNGWEYKAAEVSGTSGAADPSGPLGDGRRLRSGERLLWFWCHAAGAGCQRTLAVAPASSTVARGASLAVTVNGYDTDGRGAPVAGAIVTLGSDFASTNAAGRATLLAPPTAGRYLLSASRPGLVPSFPESIAVR
jgi:hypothetical protein